MNRRQETALIIALILITLARLAFAAAFPLVDDEAYYWTWSRHLSWSYPDHPPMIAALIRMTTAVAGNTSLGVRLGPVLLSLGTALLIFDLGRRMFGTTAGVLAALWYQVIPSFSLGSVFAVPDAPFVFFWVLTLWFVWRARTGGRALDWYAAGLALGLSLASKLSAVFLALSIAGFLLTSSADRKWLQRPEPFHAVALTLAVFFPIVHWNAIHQWRTFEKASAPIPWIALPSPLLNALAFAAAQLAYYGPLTCLLLLAALRYCLIDSQRTDPRFALLAWAAVPIIAATWIGSFDGLPKPHWPLPGYLIALIPAAALWLIIRTRPLWRWLVTAGVTINLLAIVALHLLPFWPTSSVAREVWGWDQVAAQLAPIVGSTPRSAGVFILTSRYQTASQIEFHTQARFLVTTPYGGDAFAVRINPQTLIDWNGVFINDLSIGPGIPLSQMFRKVDHLPPIDVTRNGQVVRRFWVYRGDGFHGLRRPVVRPE